MNPAYDISLRPMGFGREEYVVKLSDEVIGTATTEFDAHVIAVKHEIERQR